MLLFVDLGSSSSCCLWLPMILWMVFHSCISTWQILYQPSEDKRKCTGINFQCAQTHKWRKSLCYCLLPCIGQAYQQKKFNLKNSEKGYLDQILNLDGGSLRSVDWLVIKCTMATRNICQFTFPPHIAQSSKGGRQGSNTCTIIAVKFGSYCIQHKLDISLLWTQLPYLWCSFL